MKNKYKVFRKNKYKRNNFKINNNNVIIGTKTNDTVYKKTSYKKLSYKNFMFTLFLLIITVFTVMAGLSYAFFNITVTSKEFVIYTGTLAVDYEKKTDVINLEDLYPMTNTQGLNLDSHEFTVENNGTIDARYQVRLELAEEDNMVPIEYIKMSFKENDGEYSEPVLLSDLNSSLVFISNKILNPTKSNTYGIKLWIDLNAPNDIQGKSFKARIVVDSIQNVEDGYAVNTNPTIYMNKYENGNTDIILKPGETYEELGVASVTDDKDIFTPSQVTTTYKYSDGENTTIVDNIDTNQEGIYYVTYSITDTDNNQSSVIRVVAVADNSLKIYHDIDSIVNSFDENELKEVIMCTTIESGENKLYLDCKIHDTIENALASKTKGTIILTSDINRTSSITVNNDKNIILELNGKNITSTAVAIINNGTTTINDITNTSKVLSATQALNNSEIGTLTINNGSYERNSGTGTTVYNQGTGEIIINDGTFINSSTGSCIQNRSTDSDTGGVIKINGGNFSSNGYVATNLKGDVTINGGSFVSDSSNVIRNYDSSGLLVLNGGYYKTNSTTTSTIYQNVSGTITINGGHFENSEDCQVWNCGTIYNYGGNLNINGKEAIFDSDGNYVDGLYVKSTVGITIMNHTNSTANINGGTFVTNLSSDTSITTWQTAVCSACNLLTIDNGNFSSSGSAVLRLQSYGTLNINSGTFVGNNQTVGVVTDAANEDGTINIRGGSFASDNYAIRNGGNTSINICNGTFNGKSVDIVNNADGIIKYKSSVTLTNLTLSGNNISLDDTITCQ